MEAEHSNLEIAQNNRDRVEVIRDDGVRFTAVDTLTAEKGHKTAYELAKVENGCVTQLKNFTISSKPEARDELIKAATEGQ